MKLAYFLSNRASYYRSQALLDLMDDVQDIDLHIVICSSLTTPEFSDLRGNIIQRYKNAKTINMTGYNGDLFTMAYATGHLMVDCTQYLAETKPDVVVVYADRFELLAMASAAAYLHIPLVQIQAGEVSGNIDDKVRNAVSNLADMCFVSHEPALRRCEAMGIKNVFNTGCPSIDIIKNNNITRTGQTTVLKPLICIFHPHTKELGLVEQQTRKLIRGIDIYTQESGRKCYFFTSNNDPGYKMIKDIYKDNEHIEPILNMEGVEFLKLLAHAHCIIGNSSSGIREASYLAIPAINVGDRQKNRVHADNVIHCEFTNFYRKLVNPSIKKLKPSTLFGDGDASIKIVKILRETYGAKSKS